MSLLVHFILGLKQRDGSQSATMDALFLRVKDALTRTADKTGCRQRVDVLMHSELSYLMRSSCSYIV